MIPLDQLLGAALKGDSQVSMYLGTAPLRVYPFGDAPDALTYPLATWQTVAGTPENNLSETPPVDRIAVQFDVYSKTAGECWAISEAIRDVLEPIGHMTYFGNTERAPDVRAYRQTLSFDFWLNR